MARTVITKDGDVIDAIALAAYGATASYTEAVLDANPSLAGWGPVLPAGLTITLPDVPAPTTTSTIQLWD